MKRLLPRSAGNPQGFTLIELLVAIAILAILAVSGLVLFTGAQKNARDARRRQDIDAIATALETNKVQGAATTYSALAANQFAGSGVPQDNTTAKYCIAVSATVGTIINNPTTWATTDPCPTVPAGYKQVGSTQDATFENGASSAVWKVCALLETGTAPNVFCKGSAQ